MRVAQCRLDAGMESSASCGDSTSLEEEDILSDARAPTVGPDSMIFVGEFVWSDTGCAELVDFEHISFELDGLYSAKALATLVNPSVRSFGERPCMLHEEGDWNAYQVAGKTRLRVRPTTGRARVYSVAVVDGNLEISRRGMKTTMFRLETAATSEKRTTAGLVEGDPSVLLHGELQLRSA